MFCTGPGRGARRSETVTEKYSAGWDRMEGKDPVGNPELVAKSDYFPPTKIHLVAPCPWCEATQIEVYPKGTKGSVWAGVLCEECRADGPKAETTDEAVRLWNGYRVNKDPTIEVAEV